MKHIHIFLACILAAAAKVPTLAQEAPSHWVKKLGSGSYSEREKAARMLEQIGQAALPALREAAERRPRNAPPRRHRDGTHRR